MPNVAAVVLAAGGSTRMGSPKMLLPIGGKPLVVKAIDEARAAGLSPIVVVTGGDAEAVEPLVPADAKIVRNATWEAGQGSSIRVAIRELEWGAAVDAAIIILADQPAVTAEHLSEMVTLFDSGTVSLVGSEYGGTTGAPALFDCRYFRELTELPDNAGARLVLLRHGAELATVTLAGGERDIDTPADYERLKT